jgi:hypothetical protein
MKSKVILFLIVGTILTSCFDLNRVLPDSSSTQAVNEYVPLRDRVSVDDLECSLSKAVWYMMDATEMVIETIDDYVDVSEKEMARSAKTDQLIFGHLLNLYPLI